MTRLEAFYDALIDAGIPIFSVSGNGPTVGAGGCTITYNGASGPQITAAEALCAGFDWTEEPPFQAVTLRRDDGAGGDLNTGLLVGAIYVTPMRDGAYQGGFQLLVQNPAAFDDAENAGEIGIGEHDCGTKLLQWTGDGHLRIGPFASAVSQLLGTNETGYAQSYEDTDAVLSLVDGAMTFTIREGQIEDGAVTRYKIANGAVGYEQLDAALGAGDVAGPGSATDNAVALFDGTGGKTIKNSFIVFSGPATSAKTFTLPNATCTILTSNAAVTVAQGGSGRATGTTAYALVATGTTATGAQQTLASGATTEILVGGGAAALPTWTTATGSGAPVRATSPTLVTPALGTPSSGTLTNCTFPTLNQNTSGSAATLTTPRAIYGNNFDGSAALTQVIASTYGGTGNGFAKLSGPTTTEKTFTLPNANAAILTDNAAVTVAQGGSGRATGTTAYSLIATGTTATGAEQTLANGASTEILVGGGASALPAWTTATGSGAPVRATSPTLVTPLLGTPTSGVLTNCTGLPVAGGGTGLATLTNHALQVGASTSAVTQLALGTTGQLLTGVTSGDPAWSLPKPTSITAVGCRAHRVTNQTGVLNLTVTPIDLDVEPYDTDGFHSTVTNPSRITIPSGFDGLYTIMCQVYANFASGIQAINVYILLNGGVAGVASLAAGGLIFSGIQKRLVATDYVQLAILHGVGSTQTFAPSADYHASLAVIYAGVN